MNLQEEHKNLMDIIIKESKRLSNSIEEFLEFTKSSPLEKINFNLSKLIDDTLSLIEKSSENIKFIKRYNDNITLFADEKKIKQVVWNLITNSIKAIGNEGIVEITIIEDKNITLYIKDNGIGIDEDNIKKIFTPFYSEFTSGIGLGMPIVKRIIDEHNAKIKIISKKDFGTEIIINFGDINE
jgi:signal transduction histidine kinase